MDFDPTQAYGNSFYVTDQELTACKFDLERHAEDRLWEDVAKHVPEPYRKYVEAWRVERTITDPESGDTYEVIEFMWKHKPALVVKNLSPKK